MRRPWLEGIVAPPLPHVLATIDGGVAVEDLLPPGVGNSQQVFIDYVTVSEGGEPRR